MRATYEWKEGGPVESALAAMDAATKVDSAINERFRRRLHSIIEDDNAYKLANSIDKDGKPLAKLKPSTLKRRPRPGDRPLDPTNSSFRLKFKARWDTTGSKWILTARYEFPHAVYHHTGTRKMARRDLSGLSPKGREEVAKATKAYAEEVRKSLTIRGRFAGLARHILGGR